MVREDILKVLKCPICKSDLEIGEIKKIRKSRNKNTIMEGTIICKGFPRHKFAIKNRVIVFLQEGKLQRSSRNTASLVIQELLVSIKFMFCLVIFINMRGYCPRCKEYRSDDGIDAWRIIWRNGRATCERSESYVDIWRNEEKIKNRS